MATRLMDSSSETNTALVKTGDPEQVEYKTAHFLVHLL